MGTTFRIGPGVQEPRDQKNAQDLAENEKHRERFVTFTGIDHCYEQKRQADLATKDGEHVAPDDAQWPE